MRISEILNEMATPSAKMVEGVYYHGTKSKEAAQSIWKNGLDSTKTEIKYGDKNPTLRPVKGRVYVTPDIAYATIYAIGGNYIGTSHLPRDSTSKDNGYVFVFDGSELGDVQPDEDNVGEMISNCLLALSSDRYKDKYTELTTSRTVRAVASRAVSKLAPSTISRAKDGDCLWQTKIGKAMLKTMSDAEKNDFIELGAHIANEGRMMPKELWAVPFSKISKLEKDCSNFFQIATKKKSR